MPQTAWTTDPDPHTSTCAPDRPLPPAPHAGPSPPPANAQANDNCPDQSPQEPHAGNVSTRHAPQPGPLRPHQTPSHPTPGPRENVWLQHPKRPDSLAAPTAYNHKATVVGEIIASSIKTRYRIAPIPNTELPPTFPHPPPSNAPHLRGPASSTPRPHQDASPHTSSCATPDPETQQIQAAFPIPSSPHLSLPHPSLPHPSRPKPSTAASMRSHFGPRPTQTRRFLHMPPTRPH